MNSLTIAIQQFSEWRKAKGRAKGKIPECLWEAAVAAALELDPITVSRVLGLVTHELRTKMRVMQAPAPLASPGAVPSSDVVVFPADEILPPSTGGALFIAEILIRNRIHLRIPAGTSREDLKALLGAVWEVV